MHVVAHEPHAWFLLEEDGALYLDVNCSYSAAGFSVLIRLTEDEARRYREGGERFVAELADDVQYRALTTYRERNVHARLGPMVTEAVGRWRASNPPRQD